MHPPTHPPIPTARSQNRLLSKQYTIARCRKVPWEEQKRVQNRDPEGGEGSSAGLPRQKGAHTWDNNCIPLCRENVRTVSVILPNGPYASGHDVCGSSCLRQSEASAACCCHTVCLSAAFFLQFLYDLGRQALVPANGLAPVIPASDGKC